LVIPDGSWIGGRPAQKSQIGHNVGYALAVQQRPVHDNGAIEIRGYLLAYLQMLQICN